MHTRAAKHQSFHNPFGIHTSTSQHEFYFSPFRNPQHHIASSTIPFSAHESKTPHRSCRDPFGLPHFSRRGTQHLDIAVRFRKHRLVLGQISPERKDMSFISGFFGNMSSSLLDTWLWKRRKKGRTRALGRNIYSLPGPQGYMPPTYHMNTNPSQPHPQRAQSTRSIPFHSPHTEP
jgi:hypothetical protein